MNKLLATAAATAAALMATTILAQPRGGNMDRDRSATAPQERQMDRDQTYDRDRLLDRDTTRDMDRDRDRDQDQDRDHVALHTQDRDRLQDQDIYGTALMSAEERAAYRERLANAQTDQEWAQIRAEHERAMQTRAEQRGTDLAPPIYGQFMMTISERAQYRQRLETATSDGERAQIRSEHAERMQERARELGVELPPAGS